MIQIKKLPFYIDLAFCLFLLPAMIMLLPIERWLVYNSVFVYLLIGWLYLIYMINRRFTMPYFFKGNKYILFAILFLLLAVAGTYLITHYQMEYPHQRMRKIRIPANIPKIQLQQQAVWFLYMVVTTFSLAVGLLTELHRQIMARQEIEFEKKKAELALYKAQINPHFLFNNLNTLYAMVVTGSPQAEDAFTQFISLMKYMYAHNTKDKIPIRTETEYIRQYIELQKYRMPKDFHIHFSYEHDETEQLSIAPMILITFVENVFKHGVSSHQPGDACICIQAKNGELLFTTWNPLLNHSPINESKGIGIENCQKRLELLYSHRYDLRIEKKEELFHVTLRINLNT
ncbi:MAG: sensor histidine kinase [Parabacteroides sp.]|nr:sensor histidine kinase [Parabacteroides sp.]